MRVLRQCRPCVRIMDETVRPREYLDAREVIRKHMETLEKAFSSGNALMSVENAIYEFTPYAYADPDVELNFISRCRYSAPTRKDKEQTYFRFAPCVDKFETISVVRLNEIFWMWGMRGEFEIDGKMKRTGRNGNEKSSMP